MTLTAVRRGVIAAPIRVLLYGPPGIGKTSFGAAAPAAIFLAPEEGTEQLDVARFPRPDSWRDILDGVQTLIESEHEYQSLVLDTLDGAEPLCWDHCCKLAGWKSIEQPGYGKGYSAAVDQWRVLLARLEELRAKRHMNIVLLAHSRVRTFSDPEGDPYDRYELKMHERAAGLLKDWVDDVLFAQYQTFHVKGTRRAESDGARVINTTRRAAYDAKNRHSLPERLPLNWDEYATAVKAHRASEPDMLRQQIADALVELGDAKFAEVVNTYVAQVGDNSMRLAESLNRVRARIGQKQSQPTQETGQ